MPEKMSPLLAALADELRERARSHPDRIVVGIIGAPGAGKSTLAQRLLELIGPELSVVVPMDGFHLSQSVIRGTELERRRGAPDTFDVGGYLSLLQRLRENNEDTIYAPDYRRSIEDPVAAAIAISKSVQIVLTEGNYLLADTGGWGGVRQFLTESWFVEAPHATRLGRLKRRHIAFGKAPELAEQWATGSDEVNAKFVESTRSLADRIIDWS